MDKGRNTDLHRFESIFRKWVRDNDGSFHDQFKGEPVVAATFQRRDSDDIQVWVEKTDENFVTLSGWRVKGAVSNCTIDLNAKDQEIASAIGDLMGRL